MLTVSPLQIGIGNSNYTIPPKSFLIQQDAENCNLNIALDNGKDLPSEWIILGASFFKDFVTVISYNTNNFSFGLSKDANVGAKIEGP